MRAAETYWISIIGLITALGYILCRDAELSVMETVYIAAMVALAVCTVATTIYQNKEK